jgi:predicted nucleic acid-binding protein
MKDVGRYLLDTSVLIDFSKGWEPARSRIAELIAGGDEIGVSAINVAEFFAGLPTDKRADWDAFFGALDYWEISRGAATRAGIYRYAFARAGQTITTADALIAAVAWERAAVLITRNAKDFPMLDVQVEALAREGN